MNYLTRAHTAKYCDQCGEELDDERIFVPLNETRNGDPEEVYENVFCVPCANEVAETAQEKFLDVEFFTVIVNDEAQRALPVGNAIGCGIPLYSNLTIA